MEAHEFMTNFNVKPAEVLHDKIGERGDSGSRTVRLSFEFEYGGMMERVAYLGVGAVTLYSVDFAPDESEGEKALETFKLNAEQMDTLAAAWIEFRSDVQHKVELYEANLAQERAALAKRASKLGATLTFTDADDEYFVTYSLDWPVGNIFYPKGHRSTGMHKDTVIGTLDTFEREDAKRDHTNDY